MQGTSDPETSERVFAEGRTTHFGVRGGGGVYTRVLFQVVTRVSLYRALADCIVRSSLTWVRMRF